MALLTEDSPDKETMKKYGHSFASAWIKLIIRK
jgi:hypothetical protein